MKSWEIKFIDRDDEDTAGGLCRLESSFMRHSWNLTQWREYLATTPDRRAIFLASAEPGADMALGVGFLVLGLNPWSQEAHLLKVGVLKSFEGSGAAGDLMREAMDWLRHNAYETIFLEVDVGNARAISFYRRLGFEELCVKKGFYSDGADALAMLLQL